MSAPGAEGGKKGGIRGIAVRSLAHAKIRKKREAKTIYALSEGERERERVGSGIGINGGIVCTKPK